jgi:hypothetical protein
MTIQSYVEALETLQSTLKLYDEQLHDINFDIGMTEIGNWVRLSLLSLRKLKVELAMSKTYAAITSIENDLFVDRGIHYVWR